MIENQLRLKIGFYDQEGNLTYEYNINKDGIGSSKIDMLISPHMLYLLDSTSHAYLRRT